MAYVYRADQVGGLTAARAITEATSPQEVDALVEAALAMQKDAGIDILTDGELRRSGVCSIFVGAVDGINRGEEPNAARPYVDGALNRYDRLTAREVEFLKRKAGSRFKVTLPSPSTAAVQMYRAGVTSKVYPTPVDLAVALAPIIRQELADLMNSGVPYVQLNCQPYDLNDQAAGNPDTADMLAADVAAIRDLERPAGVVLSAYLPRGERQAALGRLEVDRFLIEFDAEAPDFSCLRSLPPGRIAVLGLVSVQSARESDLDGLLDRIDEAATIVSADQLAICPSRGFTAHGAADPIQRLDAQRRALMLTADIARRYWGIEL